MLGGKDRKSIRRMRNSRGKKCVKQENGVQEDEKKEMVRQEEGEKDA